MEDTHQPILLLIKIIKNYVLWITFKDRINKSLTFSF